MERLLLLTVFFSLIVTSSSLKCHACGGAESIPKFAKNAFNKLNISLGSMYGNCRASSGSDVCSNGTFCMKKAKVYQINYSGINLKWTTFTKGCVTLREDNNGTPTNTCYDLGQVSNTSGYTAKRVDCYCQNDLCNSKSLTSPLILFLIMSILLVVFTM